MIDLLINMSEIYGRPNGHGMRTIAGNDIINGESSEWNSGPENDENNEPVINGDYPYANSKNLKIIFRNSGNLFRFFSRYNINDKSSKFIIN
jgi:hypothetical protein